MKLGYFYWDPDPAIWNTPLPLLNRPLLWYGVFFALGFFLAYRVLLRVLGWTYPEKKARDIADRLTLLVMMGSIIGARVGELLFYQDWRIWIQDPTVVWKVWEGGLASHGGALGILVALIIFTQKKESELSGLQRVDRLTRVLDWVAMPTALAAVFIRMGNFINQEILGRPTQMPWGVMFGHPAGGGQIVPRHPVQLYEAAAYLILFALLWGIWQKKRQGILWLIPDGRVAGIFLVVIFLTRGLLEFFKEEQSAYFSAMSYLTMGQVLSFPFLLFGGWLLLRRCQ